MLNRASLALNNREYIGQYLIVKLCKVIYLMSVKRGVLAQTPASEAHDKVLDDNHYHYRIITLSLCFQHNSRHLN